MEFVSDLGIPGFLSHMCRALDLLERDIWQSILARVVLLHLREEFLRCRLGDVGCIALLERIWDMVSEDFQRVTQWDPRGAPSPFEYATIMA